MTSALVSNADRVLLFNPAVHDTRIHWARWHQPNTLLRLGTWFRQNGAEVRLVDALYRLPDERLRRERVRTLLLDGEPVHTWRFGQTRAALARELRALSKGGWVPDLVYVECFTTLWWEGAAEAVTLARVAFPHARVVILGGYPQMAAEHAQRFTAADEVWTTTPSQLARLPATYADYPRPPTMAYVYLDGGRTPCEIVDEVTDAAARKIQHFAFPEHDVAGRFPDLYPATLEELAKRRLRVSLYSLGNIAPGALIRMPELAELMRRAGYKQVAFADDREAPVTREADDALIDTYQQAASLCRDAGFRERTEALSAGICVGRLGENVPARARVITLVAHHMGSVVLWPYQPSPDESPELPLEECNGKLFPLRSQNSATYRDYVDLLSLAVVLSSKYRSRTFDFLGRGFIAHLFRDSISRRAWDPDPEVKGSMSLPAALPR